MFRLSYLELQAEDLEALGDEVPSLERHGADPDRRGRQRCLTAARGQRRVVLRARPVRMLQPLEHRL